MPGFENAGDVARRYGALVALQLIIGIHVALDPSHLEEKLYIGVLFAIGNAALFAAMLLMVSLRFRQLGWALAALISAGEFVGFVLSRTTGLPQGYKEDWVGAPENYLGLCSLFLELIVIGTALVTLRKRQMGERCEDVGERDSTRTRHASPAR